MTCLSPARMNSQWWKSEIYFCQKLELSNSMLGFFRISAGSAHGQRQDGKQQHQEAGPGFQESHPGSIAHSLQLRTTHVHSKPNLYSQCLPGKQSPSVLPGERCQIHKVLSHGAKEKQRVHCRRGFAFSPSLAQRDLCPGKLRGTHKFFWRLCQPTASPGTAGSICKQRRPGFSPGSRN